MKRSELRKIVFTWSPDEPNVIRANGVVITECNGPIAREDATRALEWYAENGLGR